MINFNQNLTRSLNLNNKQQKANNNPSFRNIRMMEISPIPNDVERKLIERKNFESLLGLDSNEKLRKYIKSKYPDYYPGYVRLLYDNDTTLLVIGVEQVKNLDKLILKQAVNKLSILKKSNKNSSILKQFSNFEKQIKEAIKEYRTKGIADSKQLNHLLKQELDEFILENYDDPVLVKKIY